MTIANATTEPDQKPAAAPAPERHAQRELAHLSVIIPAYNEASAIQDTLVELRQACPEAEIIVVDDGSSDSTGRIAGQVEGVTVHTHTRNRGYGAALKTGIRRAHRPVVAWYDADGQHNPHDLKRLALPVIRGEREAMIGVRGADSPQQRNRALGKLALRFVVRFVSGEQLADLNCGLRCFRRDIILRYLHLLPDGFSASTTSTLLLLKRGYNIGEAHVRARTRVGKSTVRFFSDGLRTVQLIVRIVVLFEALRVFTSLGLLLLVAGLAYGIPAALVYGRGIPTLASTSIVGGLLTFFMGIIADQIVELRKERFENPGDVSDPRGEAVK
jgi:glycosyltransferase involved in cell wall biosynthesis